MQTHAYAGHNPKSRPIFRCFVVVGEPPGQQSLDRLQTTHTPSILSSFPKQLNRSPYSIQPHNPLSQSTNTQAFAPEPIMRAAASSLSSSATAATRSSSTSLAALAAARSTRPIQATRAACTAATGLRVRPAPPPRPLTHCCYVGTIWRGGIDRRSILRSSRPASTKAVRTYAVCIVV